MAAYFADKSLRTFIIYFAQAQKAAPIWHTYAMYIFMRETRSTAIRHLPPTFQLQFYLFCKYRPFSRIVFVSSSQLMSLISTGFRIIIFPLRSLRRKEDFSSLDASDAISPFGLLS